MGEINWTVINSFAPWFSAIGTISAVVVALRLARRRVRPELKVGTEIFSAPAFYTEQPPPDYMIVRIVNHGEAEAQVDELRLVAGVFDRQLLTLRPEVAVCYSVLPVSLRQGQPAKFIFTLQGTGNVIDNAAVAMFLHKPWWRTWPLRVRAGTAVGLRFHAAAPMGLASRLRRRARQLAG
jgi:hypothetical protein